MGYFASKTGQPAPRAHRIDPRIVRANDLRGEYGRTLGEADAAAIGFAFARRAATRTPARIAVGYDGRLSSPALEEAVVNGLIAGGAEVLRVGLGPAPMLYFAVHRHDLDGGVMITGSHNAPEINGIKLLQGKRPLAGAELAELVAAAAEAAPGEQRGSVRDFLMMTPYLEALRASWRGGREMRIAWDPGHGATAELVCRLAAALPGRHFVINDTIDGRFPDHAPDPTRRENLDHLIRTVRRNNCEIGLAFDGDGDRLGVVTGEGGVAWADQLVALFAEEVLQARPGAAVVIDIKASEAVRRHIRGAGGRPVLSASGRGFVWRAMQESAAPLGGEMSGHIFFADRSYGYDDALYAAIRLLSLLARGPQTLAERLDLLPRSCATPELRIPCDPELQQRILNDVGRQLAERPDVEVMRLDGLHVTEQDGWWLLRSSNTEDVLVARCEAADRPALERVLSLVRGHLGRYQIATDCLSSDTAGQS